MRKNIKLIPLFLFLFVFQLLYFLSTIYTEKIDHMFLILAVFMVLICILLYCVLSDVLKKSNTEMELAFLQKQKQLKQEQDYSLQIRRQDTRDFQIKTVQGLQDFQSLLEQEKYEQADTAIRNLNQTFQKERFHPYCQNNLLQAILEGKRLRAEQKHIQVSYEILLPEKISINTTDLSSIFFNLLDNAIEVKIGMVSDKDLIHVIAEKLKQYKAENIVVDPVMVATSGAKLISDDAVEILKQELFPLADVLTPNIPEAEVLVEMSVTNAEEMIEAAGKISETYHCAVLCKGGHSINDANDLLYYDGKYCWFEGKRIDNPNTHGTGCTLSSAIASNLAKGYDLQTAVKRSKQYISGALAAMLDLGKGSGPMDHGFAIRNEYVKESEK